MTSPLFVLGSFLPCVYPFMVMSGGFEVLVRNEWSSPSRNPRTTFAHFKADRAEQARRVHKARMTTLMGTEHVDDIDVDIDTEKIDAFGGLINQVKMDGRVSSSRIIFDCPQGDWLLAQMAYDRKIRCFSSRSLKHLSYLSEVLPEDSRYVFTGALHPKQAKRLIKIRRLSAILVEGPSGPRVLMDVINEERNRLASKNLSRVSESRGRYLLERAGSTRTAKTGGAAMAEDAVLDLFLLMGEGQEAADVIKTIRTIHEECPTFSVKGLWGSDLDETVCLKVLEAVLAETNMGPLKVRVETSFGILTANATISTAKTLLIHKRRGYLRSSEFQKSSLYDATNVVGQLQ